MSAPQFSGAVVLSDLSDYLAPSQECVKPLIDKKKEEQQAKKRAAAAPSGVVRLDTGGASSALQPPSGGGGGKRARGHIALGHTKPGDDVVTVSLYDCLACSGCVTSAETVLITQQSTAEFLSVVRGGTRHVVVSLSAASRASIATHFGCSITEAHRKMAAFLQRTVGVADVVDVSYARDLSLRTAAEEFVRRYRARASADADADAGALPMLASACPGWVCYAEKRHGEYVLPYISTAKSPQQVMGVLLKGVYARERGIAPAHVYHAAVMPCYDKKLEATRPDFHVGSDDAGEPVREVDTVLTTTEFLELLTAYETEWADVPAAPLPTLFTNAHDGALFGARGGSGGFAEHILRHAARELFDITVGEVEWSKGSNGDMWHTSVHAPGEDEPVLSFAIANGFRNIQNTVRRLKRKGAKQRYDYVEVMACPGGCLNGGGQIKPPQGTPVRRRAEEVNAAYHAAGEYTVQWPDAHADAMDTLARVRGGEAREGDGEVRVWGDTALHTEYHHIEKVDLSIMEKW